jgi:SAM-dependent methyltransferase
VQHHDRRRASSFGDDAEQYDRARPTYPADLVGHLMRDNPKMVVDAGCGTGIASRLFIRRGCRVIGVEPDPRMAEIARRHGLSVEDDHFEEWDPAGRRFDLVVSGQAWHWVDPVRGASKAGETLRPGGRIGVFWNRGQLPDGLRSALDTAYRQLAPWLGHEYSLPSAARAAPDHDCRLAAEAFAANDGFGEVEMRVFTHRVEYTTAEWIDQLPTHSDHRTMAPDLLAEVLAAVGTEIDRFGGRFEMRYHTWLAEARAGGEPRPATRPPG